jgi:hypothetical protein
MRSGGAMDAGRARRGTRWQGGSTFRLLICPTGCPATCLSSPICKNIPLRALPKSTLYPPPSRSSEGRFAIVTDAARDAVDASGALDESC